jgi:hypothetical protein
MNAPPVTFTFKKGIKIKPFKVKHPIRTPLQLQASAAEYMAELKRKNVIADVPIGEPATEWVLQSFFVKRPHSSKARLIVDCQPLNAVVMRPVTSFSPANEVLSQVLPKSKWFCRFDIKDAYFCVALDEEAQKICTFLTEKGRMRCLRMPMGMSVSSDEFLSRCYLIFEGIPDIVLLIDDVLLQAETFAELLRLMRLTLDRCRKYNVSFGLAKMVVAGPGDTLTFAGYRVSDKGFQPDEDRVRAIKNYPQPGNLTDIRSFLSLSSTLGSFLPNLSMLTEDIRLLLTKGTPFVFGEAQMRSLAQTKKALTGPLVKKPFDSTLPPGSTQLYCDAANSGLGYALTQEPLDGGGLHLIQCGSRTLTKAEKNYSILELEATAIAWSIRRSRFYLLAHPPFFQVFSDHKPLQYLFASPIATLDNPRLYRIRQKVLGYNFIVTYLEGKDQTIADPLSRHAVDDPTASDEEEEEGEAYCCATYSDPLLDAFKKAAADDILYQQVKEALELRKNVDSLPTTHPAKAYKDMWHQLSLEQGLICREGHMLIVPKPLQEDILTKAHSMHQGINKSKAFLRKKYFFIGMNNQIETEVGQCPLCQLYMASQPSQPIIPLISSRVLEILDCDLFQWGGKDYVSLADRFSGFIWAELIPNETSAAVIKFLRRIMNEYGYCNILYSDSGPCFTSQEFLDFLKSHGIVPEKSAAHSPSTNGVAESHVKIAKRILKKSANYRAWQAGLARYRNCPRPDSHNLSPSSILFQRELREPDLATLPPKLALTPESEKVLSSKLAVSRKNGGHRKELSHLEVGQKVLIQSADSGLWRESGIIQSIDNEFERSYWVKRDGRAAPVRRNRGLLRPLPANSSSTRAAPTEASRSRLESSSRPVPAAQVASNKLRRSDRLSARARPDYCT